MFVVHADGQSGEELAECFVLLDHLTCAMVEKTELIPSPEQLFTFSQPPILPKIRQPNFKEILPNHYLMVNAKFDRLQIITLSSLIQGKSSFTKKV